MVNRAKAKGTAAETAVAGYLTGKLGVPVDRMPLYGAGDRGDLRGVIGWALEVKAARSPDYGAWLAEVERERVNAGAQWGAVIHKPHGLGVERIGRWRVVMTLDQWTDLLGCATVNGTEGEQ